MPSDRGAGFRLVGRSSSHFTRVTRVFAHELGMAYEFRPVANLLSRESADYAGNPALKLPILETATGQWFGAQSICRELVRACPNPPAILWPEQLRDRVASNAQELVSQGMTSEVALIMSELSAPGELNDYQAKLRAGLTESLAWLEANLPAVLRELAPQRRISFLEVSAFCFLTHLAFRSVLDPREYPRLQEFCGEFRQRESARSTEYRFDAA
jgi:glutathione S-transferase